MNYLDIFFIVIFIIGAFKGYMKGLLVEIFSFLAFFVGLFVAIKLTIPVAHHFFDSADYFQGITIAVFVALFIIVILLINLIAKALKKVLDLTFLGLFDNILGAVAGIFKWAFIISVFFWVFDSIGLRLPNDQAGDSLIYPFIQNLGPATFELVSNMLPFLQDMIDSLKNISDKHKGVYTLL